MKYFIIFGPPGAGKGTQAGNIAQRYNICHISTGALLRAEIAAGTELGKQAALLIDAGNFVSDDVIEGILEGKIASTTGVNGFLLDGFPRTLSQAEDLDRLLAKNGDSVTCVLSLMIPDEMIAQRIAHRATIEGRADDADIEIINNRIRTYHEKTEPLINFYKQKGIYFEADGRGTIEEVAQEINAILDKIQ